MEKRKVKVTADSTCDLSPELIAKYDISIIPLYVFLGEDSFRDGVDLTNEGIFSYCDQSKGLAHTAALNHLDYLNFFKPFIDEGYEVVHINLSSELSSCHQNAVLVANELSNVYVVNSCNLSTGMGHLTLMAAEMAEKGYGAAEIAESLKDYIDKVDASFILDTLDYLHKGGRCSTLAALGSNLLSLKPCIEVHDGKMGVGKKYRGNLKKCSLAYVNDRLANLQDIDPHRIFLTHTHLDEEIISVLYDKIASLNYFEEIHITKAGGTISCHCGPNCMGVLYLHK